jgi:malonyl-CoA/methylmalonyl-CoA synthetase
MPGHFMQELRATFAERRDRPAIIYRDRSISYSELETRLSRCAGWLQGLGVEPGDRVAVCTPHKLPFLAAHLGAIAAGAISLPLNPRSTLDELRHYLADSGARVVVVHEEQRATIEELRAELAELDAVVSDDEAWNADRRSFHEHAIGHDALCLMLYSSGTTGRPKGVVHDHANLASSLRALQTCWRFTADDVLLNVLPLYHIHGLSFATHLCLLAGGCMRIDDSFHPKRTLELVGQSSIFMAIPTFYHAFLDRPGFREAARGWSGVRLFTCGSAPIRSDLLAEVEAILGRPVINRYGMTEAHVITSLPLDGPWPTGSVGRPLEGIEVRVANDDGAAEPTGAVGTVLLRGPNLFREYWRNPDATRDAFPGGWFDTGDLGSFDSAGFLTLSGRKHDLIITNGYNVYPQVVERVINECPGVRESAVVGLSDRRRGERVVAVIVRDDPSLDEGEVRAHWAARLVEYQRPSSVLFVSDLPRNSMGKVLRRELRAQLEAGQPVKRP